MNLKQGSKWLNSRMSSNNCEIFSLSVRFSNETLRDEILPTVTEKDEFDYRDN